MKAGNVYTAYRTDKEREEYRARQQEEVDANYGAFKKMLPRLLKEHSGEYVLMRKGKVVEFFPDYRTACEAGDKRFADFHFSVQKVCDEAYYAPSIIACG